MRALLKPHTGRPHSLTTSFSLPTAASNPPRTTPMSSIRTKAVKTSALLSSPLCSPSHTTSTPLERLSLNRDSSTTLAKSSRTRISSSIAWTTQREPLQVRPGLYRPLSTHHFFPFHAYFALEPGVKRLKFRINEVSIKHREKKFVIELTAFSAGYTGICSDIQPVCSVPIGKPTEL